MSKLLLQLPVPAYLKKILEVKYGDSFIAKQNQSMGLTIFGALSLKRAEKYEHKLKNRFESHFNIWINLDKAKRQGYDLQQKRAYQIAKAEEREIRTDLYITAITNKHLYGLEYQTTLQNWLDMYDITEEELSYESLRKAFNRFLYDPKNKTLINKICV